jgi:hypothetical protein
MAAAFERAAFSIATIAIGDAALNAVRSAESLVWPNGSLQMLALTS